MNILCDFYNLFFPDLCTACGTPLFRREKVICLKCQYDLPRTKYESYVNNPVSRLFWGRVRIENASSYFLYQKGSRFQALIHELKYKGRKEIGIELGRMMGVEFNGSTFAESDMILPVPLHRNKQIQRGYNQCDPICQGLSSVLDIPYFTNILERTEKSSSQTSKSRINRWGNVEGIFRVKHPGKLLNKHILLADDVVTTGSTLEACANAILNVRGTRVSIATLAVALKSF